MVPWSGSGDKRRLPEGMVRIGYDADSQRYQFHDTYTGTFWEGGEGSEYGKLRRVSTGTGQERMFRIEESESAGLRREQTWSATAGTEAPATDFSDILRRINRPRSQTTTAAGAAAVPATPRSNRNSMIQFAIRRSESVVQRSASVTDKLTRRLSRRLPREMRSKDRYEPLLEETRNEKLILET